jgi:hypothetical protein
MIITGETALTCRDLAIWSSVSSSSFPAMFTPALLMR